MNSLIEDYLKERLSWSDLQVQKLFIKDTTCTCVYKYYHGGIGDTIENNIIRINVWELLNYVYNKQNNKE
jgi:hypothetical protein